MTNGRRQFVKGQLVEFIRKDHIARYGHTGMIMNVSQMIDRKFGHITTLVDIATAARIDIQWPSSWVRRDTIEVNL